MRRAVGAVSWLVGGVRWFVGGGHCVDLHRFLHTIPEACFNIGGDRVVLSLVCGYASHGLMEIVHLALLKYPGDISFVLEATDVCPEEDALLRWVVLAPLFHWVSQSGHVIEASSIASGGLKCPLL